MRNPIPSPRRSDDIRPMSRPLPRWPSLVGPACPVCHHPSCRIRRAQRLPRLSGHRTEFSREHAQAAAIQARRSHLVIWWGEATQSFWIATSTGLTEARDLNALLAFLWPHTDPPATRPWARSVGGHIPGATTGPIDVLKGFRAGRRALRRTRARVPVSA